VTSLATLELFVSLVAQVTLLIGAAAWITRRQRDAANTDRFWAALHISILLVTAAAFFLPHLRLATWADFHPTTTYPAGRTLLQTFGTTCGWIWAIGSMLVFVAGAAGMIKATLIMRAAKTDASLRKRLVDAVPTLAATSNPVDIRSSNACVGVFCWQIHRPVIAIPQAVADFSLDEQAAIVRHELAHLRCQHPLHLFLQRLVEAIYWFHPLVWWASRQAAAAREIRCDRDAVSSREDAAAYLRSILKLVEMRVNGLNLLPAGLSFLGNTSLLRRRAKLLVESFDTPKTTSPRWKVMLTFGSAVAICVLIWLPVNPRASRRADFSPWPAWTARSLDAIGMPVRDYEIDGHRLDGHEHLE
jgi:beta-lactamase regulating signal transducer with metallopeptidase domain